MNLGNYESARLDVEAAVSTGGSPESTLDDVQRWVDAHLPLNTLEFNDILGQQRQKQEELAELEDRLRGARDQWAIVKKFLDYLGIEVPPKSLEDLPF